MLINMSFLDDGTINFDNGEYFGYAGMVIALSMVFFGVKSYRDNTQKGAITFGQGVKVGLLITLVASLMYAVTWEIYYQVRPEIQTTFMEKYTEHTLNKMQEKGASTEELKQKMQEMNGVVEMYKNPLIRFGITLIEILPVGIFITLLSAALLRRREFLPA